MARNGSGVKAASKSSVEIEFTYNGQRCRERVKCQPTPANLRRLEHFREKILESIELGQFDYQASFPDSTRFKPTADDHKNTVGYWLDKHLDRSEHRFKASTYAQHRRVIAVLKPVFGHIKIDELKRGHVRDWCKTLNCGNRRIRNLILPLKMALECAIDDEVIQNNPLRDFSFANVEPPQEDHVDPLTKAEYSQLMTAISGPFKNLIQFAIWTGLRTSELVALEWGDIDFVRGVIRVNKAKTHESKKIETTKTRTGTREVTILAPALEALNAQKQHSFMLGKEIFLNNGKPYTGAVQIWHGWKRALLKAGIRYRIPYQTRHTYASYMLSAEEPIAWVAKQMGHSSPTTTAKHYARYMKTDNAEGSKAVAMFS